MSLLNIMSWWYGADNSQAYEKTTVPGGSWEAPLSQNTGGGCELRKKKNGSRGKKNPRRTPCKKEGWLADEFCERDADPPLSKESIHSSSRERACSSSARGERGNHGQRRRRTLFLGFKISVQVVCGGLSVKLLSKICYVCL